MTRAKAEAPEAMPGAGSKGRGRKFREYDGGASGVTATTEICWTEADERLMEALLHQCQKTDATRVVRGKGMEAFPKWTRPLVEFRSLAHE